jgi:chromosome segregation ATPase
MKKLTKDQLAARDDLMKRLREAGEHIAPAIEAANAAIDAYNAILADVETWRDEIVGEMESYVEERSEKWHESDAASEYSDWKGEFEGLDASEIDALDIPETELADNLEALPDQPGGM